MDKDNDLIHKKIEKKCQDSSTLCLKKPDRYN